MFQQDWVDLTWVDVHFLSQNFVAKTLNDCWHGWHGSRGIELVCSKRSTSDISGLGTINSRQRDHKQNPVVLASPSTSDVTQPGTTASRREW